MGNASLPGILSPPVHLPEKVLIAAKQIIKHPDKTNVVKIFLFITKDIE